MRALFGLVSLLVCAVIVAYLWATYMQTTAPVATHLRDQAEQLSGRGADGVPAADSIQTEEADDAGGHFKGLRVTAVSQGGAMQTMYGLQKDDVIVGMESLTVNELNSAEAMKGFLTDAYQKNQPLAVIRHGEQITLPLPGTGAGAGGSLQNQINGMVKQSQR